VIEVPALVSEDLFAAVQSQLEENRQRKRARSRGDCYLLQGSVVCRKCGYACYGKPVSRVSIKGNLRCAYYRCTCSDAYRFGGQRLCLNKHISTYLVDAAVLGDVRSLLSEPNRIRAGYERRRKRTKPDGGREVDQLKKLIKQVKKSISPLIDAYEEGLVEKSEFELRIKAASERLLRLEDEQKQNADEES
jgi:site-specific DNA recombinase